LRIDQSCKIWCLHVCKLCINGGKTSFVDCLISLHNSVLLPIGNDQHLLILSTDSKSTNVGLQEQVFSFCKLLDLQRCCNLLAENFEINVLLTFNRQSMKEVDVIDNPLAIQELATQVSSLLCLSD
jgi:hypothetical protein